MHIIFEDLMINWQFKDSEIKKFRKLWKENVSVKDIAKELKRKPLEIGLLVIDQAESGQIKDRKQGVF